MANYRSAPAAAELGMRAHLGRILGLTAAALCLTAMTATSSAAKPPAKPPGVEAPAVPDDETDVYQVAKVRTEEATVKAEIADASATAQSLTSQANDATNTRDATDRAAATYYNSPEAQRTAADVASYKATCDGKTLYGADIARCANAFADVNPRLEAHNQTMLDFKARFAAQDELAQRLRNAAVVANAKLTKLQNYLSWLTDTDDRIVTSLGHDCKVVVGQMTLEELKHRCGNIQFDGERADLPPCATDLCQHFTLYVKPARTPEQAIEDYKNSGAASATPYRRLDTAVVPSPQVPEPSDGLNAKATATGEAALAEFKAAEARYQAELAANAAKKAADARDYAGSLAARQARIDAQQRQYAAEKADWEARVRACNNGDRSQCAQ